MKTDRLDPFKLSVELDGIAAINTCLSVLFAQESERPNDQIMSNAFIAIEEHLERISEDVMNLDRNNMRRAVLTRVCKDINHKYMNGINCIYLNYNRK